MILRNYLLIFFLTLTFFLKSQIGGTHVFNILSIANSAPAASIGGYYIAKKNATPELIISNPAILDSTFDNYISATYLNYFADFNFGNLTYINKYKFGMIAYNLNYINYGVFDERDEGGNPLGKYSAGDYIFSLSYGKKINTHLSYGINLRNSFSQIKNFYSFAISTDLSIMYNDTNRNFTLTGMARNIGVQIFTYTPRNRYSLPFELMIGFSKRLKHVPARFFITATHITNWKLAFSDTLGVKSQANVFEQLGNDNQDKGKITFLDEFGRHFIIGSEFYPTSTFILRFGFNYRRRMELTAQGIRGLSGFSWGFGFNIKKYRISYGSEGFHKSGSSNYLTISRKL